MENVQMRVEKKKLVIEIDLSVKGSPSKSGKSTILATTSGNVEVPGGDGVKIGLNVYRKS